MSDRRLLANAAWNYSGTVAEGVIGILLVRYIAQNVTQQEYGFALFTLGIAEVFILFDLGLFGLLPRGYLDERARPDGEPMRLVGSAILATAALGVVACGATIVTGLAIVHVRAPSLNPSILAHASTTVLLTGLMVAVMLPGQTLSRVYEAEKRFRMLSALNVILAVSRGALTIVALQAGFGARGIVGVVCVMSLLRVALLANPRLLRTAGMSPVIFRWDWPRLRAVWRLGGWALADNLAHHVSFGMDTLMLGALGSMRSVALFGVAHKLPLHAHLAIEKGVAVTLPSMAEQHVLGNRRETARLFLTVTRLSFAIALPIVVIGGLLAQSLLVLWVGPAYADATAAFRWLLAGTLGLSIAVPCITALYAVNAVRTDAKIAIVEAILNLGFTAALVPTYGAAGAAGATAITHLGTTFLWLVPVTCEKVGLPRSQFTRELFRGLIAPSLAAACVLVVTSVMTTAHDNVARVSGGILAGLLYLAILWHRWPSLTPRTPVAT